MKLKKKKKNPNGFILWEGKSPINKALDIALIVTGFDKQTDNDKTGNLLQSFILYKHLAPHKAFKLKEYGESVCGDCCHATYNNPKENGYATCYVRVYQSPRAVWECWRNGKGYENIGNNWNIFNNKYLRLGSFGDPAMVPFYIWNKALKEVYKNASKNEKLHTGYTHQWRKDFASELKGTVMASCDGMKDYIEATSHGWKPFRVRKKEEPKLKEEIICPSSLEANRVSSCDQCFLCDGNSKPVTIIQH